MNMPDLIAPILEQKKTKIKRYPCYVNRASGLGYAVPMLDGCLRRGVYERTHWAEKEPVTPELQLIFDEGNNQEQAILKDFLAAGVQLIEQQQAFEWKQYQISGHVDGKVLVDDDPDGVSNMAVPVEIKSMSPNIFNRVHTFEDFKKFTWTRSYMCQIMLYMLMSDIDQGIFILKNKSNGMLRQINVELDYELAEACIQAAEKINQHIQESTLPDRIDDRTKCKDCPFKHVCLPGIDFGAPIQIADDPDFERKVKQYIEGKDAAKANDKLWDVIKEMAKATAKDGELNLVVGGFRISGKTDTKGSFRTKIEEVE